MFKSILVKPSRDNKHIYDLEDDQFGVVEIAICPEQEVCSGSNFIAAMMSEYSKHNMNIEKNLALYISWFCNWYPDEENVEGEIRYMCKVQDELFPKQIENWKTYAQGRDEWLRKLSIIS